MYILHVIKKSLSLLNKHQKIQLMFLLAFFLISALVQIVGAASIGPFIAILSSPEIIHTNKLLSYCYTSFNFSNDKTFIIAFAGMSLVMIIFSNAISILTLWLLMKFSIVFGEELQSRLFLNFIGRPYIYHKSENYTNSIAVISQEAPRFIYMVVQPILMLFSNLFVALLILIGLVVLNPMIAIGSAIVLGGSYLVTYIALKASLSYHGKILTIRSTKTQSILSESFIGIKDIILNSLGEKYAKLFREINMQGLKSTAFITLSGDIPKFVIETISFGAILFLAIVFLLKDQSAGTIVSTLSIYALAGYKLLPTMQQIYKSVSALSAHGSVPFSLSLQLEKPSYVKTNVNSTPLETINHIELKSIEYTYPGSNSKALHNINLKFNAGEINTIAGHSGSGKSTLTDIILGLLDPSSGYILVNEEKLEGELLDRYQKSIGYVPQSIFILDDTVVANVAFGVPKEDIDISRVMNALTLANALDFVNALPEGIHSNLGQDGKLLSGGQKQRIGIARSLYRNNQILILDEPTSALDIESEYEFIQILSKLKENVLIIVISHRPAAIKCSDTITLLDNGIVIANSSYDHLIKTNDAFKEMMQKSMAH